MSEVTYTTYTTESRHFTSYDTTDYAYYRLTGPDRAYYNSTHTDQYASINLTRGSGASTHIYFKFNTSSLNIPSNAENISVSCNVSARTNTENTSYIASAYMQIASGTTLKGTATSILHSGRQIHTLDTGTSWTRQELDNIRVKFFANRGSSGTSSNYYMYVYGGDITITYDIAGTSYTVYVKSEGSWEEGTMYVKSGGEWIQDLSVYKKENDTWVGA